MYFAEGRVHGLRTAPDGTTIQARVRGSGRSVYQQTIHWRPGAGGRLFPSGSCTCPVGLNCKHVAAVLLAYRAETSKAPTAVALVGRQRNPALIGLRQPDTPLPFEVDAWLRNLAAAQQEDSEDYPPNVRKRLLYVLQRATYSGGLIVDLQSIELTRGGASSRASTRHKPDQFLGASLQPQFLRPSDRAILPQLARAGAEGTEGFIAALRSIIATGRGRWASWDGPALAEGPAIPGTLEWRLFDDGRQQPALLVPDPLLTLRLAVPWYVDPTTGMMGPIETALAPRLVQAMLAGPVLPAALAGRVRAEMTRRWPAASLPAPKPLEPPQILRERLQPHLLLLAGELPFDPAALPASGRARGVPSSTGLHRVALARLSWRYGGITLPAGKPFQQDRIVQQNGTLFQLIRDRSAEERADAAVRQLGLVRLDQFYMLPNAHPHLLDMAMIDPDPAAWLDLVLSDVPRLREEGWLIDIAANFPWRLVEPSGDISFEITERSGIDWFDLELGVMLDGERINLIPVLLDLIANGGIDTLTALEAETDDQPLPLLLPLPDGRLLTIPLTRLQPILAPLLELFAGAAFDEQAGTMRLSRRNAGDLALLEAASTESGLAWSGGEAIRALGRQLRDHGGIPPCTVPEGFGATLRAYQAQGLAWLQFLRTAGLGGILADDMGLGKTVQTLAHLAVEQAHGRTDLPSLVICPTSLVPNWTAEAARFAPSLRTLVLHGPARAERFGVIGAHDLVITTYPLLARDHAVLAEQDWHVVVLDEAQTIKNPLAATSRLARTLQARQRLCLSGTPLENHLGELWSLFDFLLPGLLGDRKQFGWRYRGPIEKAGNTERRDLLVQRVAPFLLRRTKEQVATDLPAKTEIAETVEMGDAQRAIYESIRLAMHAKVRAAIAERGLDKSGIIILAALLKLRQACCDPRLLKLAAAKAAKARSAKLERLLELLPQMLEEGRRVLLFSQFTSMLALIEAELAQLSIPYVLLTGDTTHRAEPIRRFQAGEVPLFLVSLKAGGVGLNLTAADTVIHYDPWWNPAVENQATDRAHRIGQDKPVFVHRLITAGTIEEKMETLKQRKQALADGILGASSGATLALTEGDLDMLFAS